MNKSDFIFWARIIPNVGLCEVLDLTVRTVEDTYFVATESKTKHAYLFNNNEVGNSIFYKRKEAVEKVKEAEKHKRKISDEKYYEEY